MSLFSFYGVPKEHAKNLDMSLLGFSPAVEGVLLAFVVIVITLLLWKLSRRKVSRQHLESGSETERDKEKDKEDSL